jgi:hypothetical protein
VIVAFSRLYIFLDKIYKTQSWYIINENNSNIQ